MKSVLLSWFGYFASAWLIFPAPLYTPARGVTVEQSKPTISRPAPIASFADLAEKAGLGGENIFGGIDTKKYIIETTGKRASSSSLGDGPNGPGPRLSSNNLTPNTITRRSSAPALTSAHPF